MGSSTPICPADATACEVRISPTDKVQGEADVEKLLRDLAFVLHLTRTVKASILADRPPRK